MQLVRTCVQPRLLHLLRGGYTESVIRVAKQYDDELREATYARAQVHLLGTWRRWRGAADVALLAWLCWRGAAGVARRRRRQRRRSIASTCTASSATQRPIRFEDVPWLIDPDDNNLSLGRDVVGDARRALLRTARTGAGGQDS